MGETLKFKRRFKPLTVEIEAKDEATHFFETVLLPRSAEREVSETLESFSSFDRDTTDEEAMDVILETVDKIIVPKAGKKTKASKILKDLWKGEEIESMDIIDFLRDLVSKRRPT